jgi:PAS domain S-box-containing protein
MRETLPTDSFPIESFINIRSLLAQAKEATLIINPQFRISYINPKAKELFHILNGSIPGEQGTLFFDLIPPTCKPLFEEKLLQCLKGQPYTYHIEVISKQGQVLCIHYQLTPVTAEEDVKGIYMTLEDITQQKELEKEEQKRKTAKDQVKTLFELFMEHAPLRAWITDKEGIVHYMNDSYKKALNIPATETTKSLFFFFQFFLLRDIF